MMGIVEPNTRTKTAAAPSQSSLLSPARVFAVVTFDSVECTLSRLAGVNTDATSKGCAHRRMRSNF